MSGFASYAERIDAQKIRERSPSFHDHFSQAALLFKSQSEIEQNHIIKALRFELGKVVPDGEASVASLKSEPEVANFLNEAYQHCKTIAASGAGVELLASAGIVTAADEISRTDKLEFRPGLVASRESYVQSLGDQFVKSIARHRHWGREPAL